MMVDPCWPTQDADDQRMMQTTNHFMQWGDENDDFLIGLFVEVKECQASTFIFLEVFKFVCFPQWVENRYWKN